MGCQAWASIPLLRARGITGAYPVELSYLLKSDNALVAPCKHGRDWMGLWGHGPTPHRGHEVMDPRTPYPLLLQQAQFFQLPKI
jgi:hypothetical protein